MSFNIKNKLRFVEGVIEAIYPFWVALAVFILSFFFKDIIIFKLGQEQLQFTNIGLAVFSWLALQVGVSFGIYAFVMGKSDGHIKLLKGTFAMKIFKKFLIRGYYSGIVGSLCTLPLIVLRFDLSSLSSLGYTMLSLWFSLFMYAFLCFIRIAIIFQKVAMAD